MSQAEIDVRHLRSALEFAVLIAEEGQKARPPIKAPASLKHYFRQQRIPTTALWSIKRIIDSDDEFRTLIANGATTELVDPIGRIWLSRGDGWEATLAVEIAEVEARAVEADLAQQLHRADKRRVAAERATARAQAELLVAENQLGLRDDRIGDLESEVTKLSNEIEAVKAELIDSRNEIRHARDRERAALERIGNAESARQAAVQAQDSAEHVRDNALADRASLIAKRTELAHLASAAESLAARLNALASTGDADARVPVARRALPMPGGVLGSSQAAAEYLLRAGASVVVDGYNVAMLAWPKLDLAGQRVVLLDHLENLTRRYGCDLTVVFDGASVVGATADIRRVVRVMYSPEGVIADDVIRDEVERLPPTRPVVVVTNDKEILRDVKANGANIMSSPQLIALFR